MTNIATGATTLHIHIQTDWNPNVPCAVVSFFAISGITHPTKSAISNPPKGNKILLDIKSKKSRKLFPAILIVIAPCDNADGIPRSKIAPPMIKAAFCLDHLALSIIYATTTSSNEIADVSAATARSRKNNADHIWPPGINANTLGNVMKVSPGPALGVAPNAKTVGKITNPARNAAAVSNNVIVAAALGKDSFFDFI